MKLIIFDVVNTFFFYSTKLVLHKNLPLFLKWQQQKINIYMEKSLLWILELRLFFNRNLYVNASGFWFQVWIRNPPNNWLKRIVYFFKMLIIVCFSSLSVVHPGLVALWSDDMGERLNRIKWNLFLDAISPKIKEHEKWLSLDEDYVVAVAVCYYLYVSNVQIIYEHGFGGNDWKKKPTRLFPINSF